MMFNPPQLKRVRAPRRARRLWVSIATRAWPLAQLWYRSWGLRLDGRPEDAIWYFAYGANMHHSTFIERRHMRPSEQRVGRLPGYRLRFNLDGIPRGRAAPANIQADRESEVWGVLYRITNRELVRLNVTEGVPGPRYQPVELLADYVKRRHRPFARAYGVQDAGERNVVDVMACDWGKRSILSPSGHASVDQPRIARQAFVRPESEPLHHAGAHRINQRVGVLDQTQNRFDTLRMLQINRNRRASTATDIRFHTGVFEAETGQPLSVNTNDIRPHIGQQGTA